MKIKTKPFDCVEMKNKIQQELLAEYESRRSDFRSYADFITQTAKESPMIKEWRQALHKAKAVV